MKKVGRAELELFCVSFIALFVELTVIRWAPSVVRLVAYYANLMLISSFLGLGVGAMIGKSRKSLLPWLPFLLAINVALLLLVRDVTLGGVAGEQRFYAANARLVNYAGLVAIFAANAAVFVPLGQRIGVLFDSLPPLRAYSWDLGGSLAGTLAFALFSLTAFSPLVATAVVAVVVAFLLEERKFTTTALPLIALLAGVWSSGDRNAMWSPYYHITVRQSTPPYDAGVDPSTPLRDPRPDVRTMVDPPHYTISVNQDFYQPHLTMDLRRYSAARQAEMRGAHYAYDLPYVLAPGHRRVLVLGAGGGTDAEVALLNGAADVDAVEIDPALVRISRRFNASGVYDDPRVHVRVDDARAFVRRAAGPYDLVVFGWLDSQALFSSMSNLRLDGYIYTVESVRAAWGLLAPEGTLSLSFQAGRSWLADKLVRMVTEATGRPPLVYRRGGQVIIVASRRPVAAPPATYGDFVRQAGEPTADARSEPPTDDWPYLYLAGRQIPADYAIVISLLLLVSLAAVVALRGRALTGDDGHFAFLGFGFLLLETKSIGDCSLYFGTTWLVTAIVVAGVLLMVLAANLLAQRLSGFRLWMYAPLLASVVVIAATDRQWVLALDLAGRLAWALLVIPLPIFFAGLVFSTTFRNATRPSALLGANLIGAMLGGFSEYIGMKAGNERLMFLVIAAYVLSLALRWRATGPLAVPGTAR